MKTALVLALLITAIAAGSARADGLPVVDVNAGAATTPTARDLFIAVPAGTSTRVSQIERSTGKLRAERILRGLLTIPAVAYDGSAAGLSHDERTLVLTVPRPTFPRASTTFVILDAETLKHRRTITLRGDFSFDAMSPDGRWLYLIQYTSAEDPLQYRVRALDSTTGRLLPNPVVDPREPGEAMNGRPLTRATSVDGRWAYTLYDGTEHPFIHALDTVGRSARCIDLDWLHGRKDLWQLRFALGDDGRRLSVRSERGTVAVVDTRTFEAGTAVAEDHRRSPWVVAGGGLALLLAGALVVYVVGSRRRAASTSVGGATSA